MIRPFLYNTMVIDRVDVLIQAACTFSENPDLAKLVKELVLSVPTGAHYNYLTFQGRVRGIALRFWKGLYNLQSELLQTQLPTSEGQADKAGELICRYALLSNLYLEIMRRTTELLYRVSSYTTHLLRLWAVPRPRFRC